MSKIESVKPSLTVILDDGDFIINSIGAIGKAMAQAVLPLAAAARKVTIIADGEMKVMKRNGAAENTAPAAQPKAARSRVAADTAVPAAPDVQDEFVADLEAGKTGEAATGEVASVASPEPSKPAKKPVPRIYQDAAAPPAPELAVQEMERLLEEAAQAEKDAAQVAENQRFQRQQAVQASQEPSDVPAEQTAEAAKPRKREPRQLATSGRPCGRCGGGGQIQGEAGFVGACPVCHGVGTVKQWDRALKIR